MNSNDDNGRSAEALAKSKISKKSPPGAGDAEVGLKKRQGSPLTAWLQVLGAFCLNFNTWGVMNAYGVYQTYYELNLLQDNSPSAIAWIGSVQAFLLFLLSFLIGPLLDRGHLRSLLTVGSVLSVVGFFMTSICSTFWQCFLAQGIAMGLGFGCLYLPAPMLVSMYFERHRALANGLASAGSGIGGVFFPLAFTQLEPRIGFGSATRVLAAILTTTTVVPLVVMRLPVNHPSKTAVEASDRDTVARSQTMFSKLFDTDALRDRPYILLNGGLLTGFMGLYVILYYIDLFALERTDAPRTLAANTLIILNGASALGRIAPAAIADRVGPMNVLAAVALTGAVLVLNLLVIRNEAGLIAWTLLFGGVVGALTGLPAVGVVSASDSTKRLGTRLGMTLAAVGVGVLVASPIAGAIRTGPGGWPGLIGWCGGLLVASAGLLLAARLMKTGLHGRVRA